MKKVRTIIGVDLGGTKTTVARFDARMNSEAMTTFSTEAARGFAAVREDVLQHVEALRRPGTTAIGIGVPGLIDRGTHRIVRLPNIPGADGQDAAAWITECTGLPVQIDNDARCFALAEALVGAGRGHAVVVGVTLGTGVGGGIVINGTLFHGAHGFAGEVGHMLLRPGSPPTLTDDRRGDAEQFLSGTAMGRRCTAAGNPRDYLQGEVCSFMHPEIIRELAWLLASITHCVDPSVIVLGGSAGRALQPHMGAIEDELRRWLLPGTEAPLLSMAILPDAAVRGAAMLVQSPGV